VSACDIAVELPHGLFDQDGACHRTALLRPLTGQEELMLADAQADPSALSELLAALLARLGDYERVDGTLASALTRGDRQVLVLRLRAGLYGDRIALVVRCPNPDCRALADVDLRIADMIPGPAEPRPWIECDTPDGGAQVREPTGADDEFLVRQDGSRAERAALLWSRLVVLDGRPLGDGQWPALNDATRHAIALALAEGSRAPELVFLARCPDCAAVVELVIDPFALLARELRAGGDRLLAEVHALAFHYHWPEGAILALPRPRRWRYLELLARELEGRPLLEGWS
jgi:hypothetical protein